MDPINFKETNVTLQRPESMIDEECQPLPVFRDGQQCVSCWRPTWREKLSILFHGKIWLSVYSGATQPPVWLKGGKTIFE